MRTPAPAEGPEEAIASGLRFYDDFTWREIDEPAGAE